MADWKGMTEDVLIKILLKLPVKSLVRFRCVSKTWQDVIKSPKFISMHLNSVKDEIVLIKSYLRDEKQHVISFHKNDNSLSQVSENLLIPYFDQTRYIDNSYLQFLGSSNGLICLTDYEIVVLCNPTLREFKLLHPNPFAYPHGLTPMTEWLAFYFDPRACDYKVVKMVKLVDDDICIRVHRQIEIYSLITDSWRKIDTVLLPVEYFTSSEVFFNGSCHVLALERYGRTSIHSFNISNETFTVMDGPECCLGYDGNKAKLAILNESLTMVRYKERMYGPRFIDIWVMKEYGCKDSWTKQFTVGPFLILCPVSFWKDHLFMESISGQLALCELNTNEIKDFGIYTTAPTSLRCIVYKESLVSIVKH